jgi:hypothetical protein
MTRRDGNKASKALGQVEWLDLLVKSLPSVGQQALFDWSSGLILLNCDESTYQSYLKGGVHTNLAEAHTITHEFVHLMQAASCGFLNLWVRRLLPLLGQAMNELGLPKESLQETKDILRNAAKTLSEDTIDEIQAHRNILNEKGSLGLTVSTIFESHAMFVQLHQHVGPWNEDRILQIIEKFSPGLVYRYAYDVARHFCLDAAFRVFHAICATSLCCTSPTDAFVALCQGVTRRELAGVGQQLDCDAFVQLARELLGTSLIGTAADLGPTEWHPIYSKFGSGTKLGALSFADAAKTFDDPSGLLALAIRELDAPLVTHPTGGELRVRVGRTPDGKLRYSENDVMVAFVLSAVNARIPDSGREPFKEEEADGRFRWLQNREKRIIALKIPRDGNPGAHGAKLAEQLSNNPDPNAEPLTLAHTWRSFILRSDIPPGTGLGCDPVVRQYVASLAERAPWFPLHLYMEPTHHASFITWFGSLASTDAWADTVFSATHPSVIDALVNGIDACVKRAEQIGQDPSAQLVAMTSPYKERMAARLFAGCRSWREKLGRIIFEVGFMSKNARAVEISLNDRSIHLTVIARALALLADVEHILDPPEINRTAVETIQRQLTRGQGVLVIDRRRSKLLSDFGHDWASFCTSPEGITFKAAQYVIQLSADVKALGFLAILRPGPHLDERSKAFELLTIKASEAETLERLGVCSLQRVDTYRVQLI